MNLGYEYRADGNFLTRVTCTSCGEVSDAHALQNADPLGYCAACRQVLIWQSANRVTGENSSNG